MLDEDAEYFQHTPTVIQTLINADVVKVAAGFLHSLAVTSSGRVYAWGCASFLGVADRVGFPVHENGDLYSRKPELLETLAHETIASVSCDEVHSLAVTVTGDH